MTEHLEVLMKVQSRCAPLHGELQAMEKLRNWHPQAVMVSMEVTSAS